MDSLWCLHLHNKFLTFWKARNIPVNNVFLLIPDVKTEEISFVKCFPQTRHFFDDQKLVNLSLYFCGLKFQIRNVWRELGIWLWAVGLATPDIAMDFKIWTFLDAAKDKELIMFDFRHFKAICGPFSGRGRRMFNTMNYVWYGLD